jgi:hypothetical protein
MAEEKKDANDSCCSEGGGCGKGCGCACKLIAALVLLLLGGIIGYLAGSRCSMMKAACPMAPMSMPSK